MLAGGFKAGADGRTNVAAMLYNEGRMEERCSLFEAITLPSVKAQADPDFTFLMSRECGFPSTTSRGCEAPRWACRNAKSANIRRARSARS